MERRSIRVTTISADSSGGVRIEPTGAGASVGARVLTILLASALILLAILLIVPTLVLTFIFAGILLMSVFIRAITQRAGRALNGDGRRNVRVLR